jgi:murein DD-endopeptidase MepM/ murein hydrolase activator NlpD
MTATERLLRFLSTWGEIPGKVVDFDAAADRLYHFDLTAANADLTPEVFSDTHSFSRWINDKLTVNNCKYGVGGYMEHRTIYARSAHFDTADEPRRLHLGIDIWAEAGIPVYTPFNGLVHSFKDNNNFGDYGPAIILEHNFDGLILYSLYGHLNRLSLNDLTVGKKVKKNQQIGCFGNITENGQWPPHLHFQLMLDMEGNAGDYPGVCRFSEKKKYLKNIPDPQAILRFPAPVNG